MEKSTNLPERHGKKWEKDEVAILLTSIQEKKSIEEIAMEHQRTIGGINAERRKLAAEFWFNDNRPIEEISRITGLTKNDVEDAIKRRGEVKNKNVSSKPSTDIKEVISLLKDIKGMLSKKNTTAACYRCGRTSHWVDNCYATYHIDGYELDD